MKKNRFLKTAGALLILCLLTTCVIGTTFAKYVTGGEATDTARVAKWGVQLQMQTNTMFSKEYEADDPGFGGLTVKASDLAVAPGTETASGTAAVFSITGTPEVSVAIEIKMENEKDVVLVAGTYLDETTADPDDVFTLTENYYPVRFTLTQLANPANGLDTDVVLQNKVTLATLKAYFATYSSTAYYTPNTVLDSTYQITWEWVYESAILNADKADTYLGNRAANLAHADGTVEGTHYVLNVAYDISITVEQVD